MADWAVNGSGDHAARTILSKMLRTNSKAVLLLALAAISMSLASPSGKRIKKEWPLFFPLASLGRPGFLGVGFKFGIRFSTSAI
jgi:hypothetical protein